MMISKCKISVLVLFLTLAVEGFAQLPSPISAPQAPTSAGPEVAEDPLGRTTPRGTVLNFMRAVERGDLSTATQYLESRQSAKRQEETAQHLKRLMDMGLRVDLNALSRSPEGYVNDGLPLTRDLVGEIAIGDKNLEILLDRVQIGKNPPIWLFSAETLLNLGDFTEEEVGIHWVERYLPKRLIENRLWGIPLYRFLFIPMALLVMGGVAWLFVWLISLVLRFIFRRAVERRPFLKEMNFVGPARLLIFALGFLLTAQAGATLLIRQFWIHLSTILILVASAWFFMRVVDLITAGVEGQLRRKGAQHRIAAVQLSRGLAKALAIGIVVLVILNFEGVNLATAITGLGIGGVAVAFAAQKTIENLFGTVMLVIDQPVRLGDFCRVGDTQGTIESIGMRSTRIRTLDRTVVSVPNGQVASMILENFAPRDKVWFRHMIGLRYKTTSDQLRYVLASIRKLLYEHPKVESGTARIRFVGFGTSSLDLEIFAYAFATDIVVFLEIQEDILLRIMDIIEASGTSLAFPSQTAYLARDPGLDAEKSKAAVALVQQWKKDKALPFPDYPPEKITEFQNTLEYPPPDSALHKKK